MKASILKRLKNKPFYLFLVALIYKILQDCGIIISPEQWSFYTDALLYLLLLLGIFVDTSTPGFTDKTKDP